MAIDPLAGYRNSRDALFQSLDLKHEQERQAKIDDMQAKSWKQNYDLGQLGLEDARQTVADKSALRSLESSLSGKNLPQIEVARQRSNLLASQGNYQGAKAALDLNTLSQEQAAQHFSNTAKAYQQGGKEGAVQYMRNVGVDEQTARDSVNRMNFTPEGSVIVTADNGQQVIALPDGKGGFQFKMTTANKATSTTTPKGDLVLESGEVISKESIDLAAQDYLLTTKMPSLGMRANVIRQAILNRSKEIQAEKGISPTQLFALQSEGKGLQDSIKKQELRIGAAGSYIDNIAKQADRLNNVIIPELKAAEGQFNTRLFNVPLRMWDKSVKGSGIRAKYEMYLTEISLEVAKIASADPQSIAEISTTAQERWNNIHDPNLSPKDIEELVTETKHAMNMRYASLLDQKKRTMAKIENLLNKKRPVSDLPTEQNAKTISKSKGKLSTKKAMEYLNNANGDRAAAERQAREDGWEF